jgi:hypothetical protein
MAISGLGGSSLMALAGNTKSPFDFMLMFSTMSLLGAVAAYFISDEVEEN